MKTKVATRTRTRQPLHERVKVDILRLIRDRGLTDGDRVPHIRELAEIHNVSYVTASRAVAALVDDGVLTSRVGDGTYVRKGAQIAAAAKRTFTVAVVFRDIYSLNSHVLGTTIHTLGEFARQNDIKMEMLMAHEDHTAAGQDTLLKEVESKQVDGLFLASRLDPRLVLRLKEREIPFVWFAEELPHYDLYSVQCTHVRGFACAIRTLRELGQKRVGVLHDPFDSGGPDAARIDADVRGETFDAESVVDCGLDRDGTIKTTRRMLEAGYDAFVCQNEQTVAWSQEVALSMDYKIPEQLIYATFASPSSNFPMHAPYICVSSPIEKMTTEASSLLLQLMQGEENPKHQRMFNAIAYVPNSIRNRAVQAKRQRRK